MLQKLRAAPAACPFLDKHVRETARVVSFSPCRSPRRAFLPPILSHNPGHVPTASCGPTACLTDPGREQSSAVLPASESSVPAAVRAVRSGQVIAVPTDTIYGFACDACSAAAIKRIYEIKGRQATKPLAICVADVSDIPRFALTDHLPPGLLGCLLPGPVTLILRRGETSALERSLNPGIDSIGVRVPDCGFVRSVARGLGGALALTSANPSGQPSSVHVEEFETLWRHCALVFDGGALPAGRAGSTVVDLTVAGQFTVARPGSAREETVKILGKFCLVEARS